MRFKLRTAAMWSIMAAMAIALGAPVAAPVAAQNRGATRPKIDRPDGPVWQVIRKNCTSCHGIDDYAFYAMDKAGWQNIIESKHRTGPGAGGADISEFDRNTLLNWLVERFGPETNPFPRNYIAPEITEFLTDPEANRLLARSCSGCHAADRVNEVRNSEDRWRVIAVQMREKGAKINDDELEELVVWLARVKGINPNQ